MPFEVYRSLPQNPSLSHDHLCLSVCTPSIMLGHCVILGRNRVGSTRGCVAYNYRSLAGPVVVMGSSQIKVQPEDLAGPFAALCCLIAGSWVSHVKWQAGKCEISDKAQSPKKP